MSQAQPKKRVAIDIAKKAEIIRKIESGTSQRQIAKTYDMAQSTVQKIYKNRDKILEEYEKNVDASSKRLRMGKFPEVEINEKVFAWFQELRGRNMPFTGDMIKAKALEIAQAHGLSPTDFKVS